MSTSAANLAASLPVAVAFGYYLVLVAFRWQSGEKRPDAVTIMLGLCHVSAYAVIVYKAYPLWVGGMMGLTLACATYANLLRGPRFEWVDMKGKVVIVTGSNTGLGLETARIIAEMGANVILACRTPAKAKAAVEWIKSVTGSTTVTWMQLDLLSKTSILKFAQDFKQQGLPLHVLINNAGMMRHDRLETKDMDNFEQTITANHLGPFLLTNELMPILHKTEGSRIVNVNSSLHTYPSTIDLKDPHLTSGYEMFKAYSRSKLAGVLCTYELSRRLKAKKTHVTVNCLHPGQVMTDVTRNMHWFLRYGEMAVYPLMFLFRKTAYQGAFTSVHVATSPKLKGVTGQYFVHCEAVSSSSPSYDEKLAQQVWDFTIKTLAIEEQ